MQRRASAVVSYAQRLAAAESDRAALTRELSEARALRERVRAELERDASTEPATKVRAAYKRLRRSSQALLTHNDTLLGSGGGALLPPGGSSALLGRLDEQLSVLSIELTALRDDLLERYYELLHLQSPRFAHNVFMYGGDEIPTSAAAATATVASIFLPLSTEALAQPPGGGAQPQPLNKRKRKAPAAK